jgi:transcriptional regulatory protein RtcR
LRVGAVAGSWLLVRGSARGRPGAISPETTVVRRMMELTNPWDFEEVYAALHDFARGYPFVPDADEYLVHITTGTHVAQLCLFLLTESRHFPGRLVQTSPHRRPASSRGNATRCRC